MKEKLTEYMNALTKNFTFSGSVLISKKGEVIFKESYGMADYEHQVKNKPDTKFRIYSMTKSFTALSILMLHEENKIALHEKANQYLPQAYKIDDRITIHHLLTHTSGLYDYSRIFDSDNKLYKQSLKKDDIIQLFIDKPLDDPGEKWMYCNSGYYLLGIIIEHLSQMTLSLFFTEKIFKPLGMKNTGMDDVEKIISNRARGYYLNDDDLINCEYIDNCALFSDGGLYSTVEDLFLFDQAIYKNILVSKETLELIFTPYSDDYGYGWFIENILDKKRISHGGGYKGFLSELHRYVDDEVTIIMLTNLGFGAVMNICEDLAKIMFEKPYKLPEKPPIYSLSSQISESYLGVYLNPYHQIEVKKDGAKYYFILDKKYKINMYPIRETVFHHTWAREAYGFYKDEDGHLMFFGAKKI